MITHTVILSATYDMIGLLGLVLFLMAGNIADVYIFATLSLGLSAIFFPRYSHWKESAQPWLGSPAAEADAQKVQVTGTARKIMIITLGWFVIILVGAVGTFFCRDNALEENYSWLVWYVFLPLVIIALFYLMSILSPRIARVTGRDLDCRPGLWRAGSVAIALGFGVITTFPVQGTLRAAMDTFNRAPTKVESVILGFSYSNHCRIKVYIRNECSICLQHIEHRPVGTPWPIGNMSIHEMEKLHGQRVILVGRKSFAGTVIDEIRLPSDRSDHAD